MTTRNYSFAQLNTMPRDRVGALVSHALRAEGLRPGQWGARTALGEAESCIIAALAGKSPDEITSDVLGSALDSRVTCLREEAAAIMDHRRAYDIDAIADDIARISPRGLLRALESASVPAKIGALSHAGEDV